MIISEKLQSFINSHVKGDKVEIGRIDLMKSFSFVEIIEADADRVIKALKHGVTVKGRPVVIDRSTDEENKKNASQRWSKESKEYKSAGATGQTKRKASNNPWKKSETGKAPKKQKPSREERGYTAPRGRKFSKEDWMKFLHPEQKKHKGKDGLVGEEPDFSEEGWARRKPKKN